MNKGRFELKGYTLHGIGLDDVCLNKGSLQEKGLSGLAITDLYTVEGWCDGPIFADESFRFIYGVDVRLHKKAYSLDDEKEYEEDDSNYAANATLLIKNEIGKKNLFDILFEASTRARHLSTYPVIEIDTLERHREGILVGYSCDNHILSEEEPNIDKELSESPITKIIDLFDYVEVAPADYNPLFPYINLRDRKYVQQYTEAIIKYTEEHNKPVVAVSGFYYLDKDEDLCWRVLQCDGEISECEGHHISEYGMVAHLRSTEELLNEFGYLGERKAEEIVIGNTASIAEQIDDIDPTAIPDCRIYWDDAEILLRKRINELLPDKYDDVLADEAKSRIDEELNWMINHRYAEMMLMFSDAVIENSSKYWDHSAYGELSHSVIAYVLGISTVDPITNGLPISFFMNAPEEDFFSMGLSVPQSQRAKYIASLGKSRGVSGVISGTVTMHTSEKEARGMLDEYERISGKRIYWEERIDIEETLTCLLSPLRLNSIQYYLLPTNNESQIDRRWSGDCLQSDCLGLASVRKKFSSFEIASGDEPDILLKLEILTGKSVSSISFEDDSPMRAFEYDQTLRAPKWMAGIYLEKYSEEILRFGIDSFEDMIRLEGLGNGKGTWDRIQWRFLEEGAIKKSDLITNREDVYDLLILNGLEESEAIRLSTKICSGAGVTERDIELIRTCGLSERDIHILKHILYLPTRAQCVRLARERFWLAYYKVNYPEAFYKAYLDCATDERERAVIMGGHDVLMSTMSLLRDYGDPTDREQADWTDFEISTRALMVADEMYRRGFSLE